MLHQGIMISPTARKQHVIFYNFHPFGERVSSYEFWDDVKRLESINLITRISPSIRIKITEKGKRWIENMELDDDLVSIPEKIRDLLDNDI